MVIQLLLVANVCANDFSLSPDNKNKIGWICNSIEHCKIYVDNKPNVKMIYDGQVKAKDPTITWHTNDLAEIRIKTDSAGSKSFFYSPTKGISSSYDSLLAVNSSKMVIAIAEQSEIVLYQLFNKVHRPFMRIILDLPEINPNIESIKEVNFVKDCCIYIKYLAGSQIKEINASIDINVEPHYMWTVK